MYFGYILTRETIVLDLFDYKNVLDFKAISLSFTIFRNNFTIKISY